MHALQTCGLSHSEIPGSMVICTYPGLIAAYHVLHRLCEPRHPPCALSYFFYKRHTRNMTVRQKPSGSLPYNRRSYFQLLLKFFLKKLNSTTVCLVAICQRSLRVSIYFYIINSQVEYKKPFLGKGIMSSCQHRNFLFLILLLCHL